MHSRIINSVQDGFFVDCGLTAEFDNEVTTIGGLSHLEGETVAVVADGGTYSLVVQNSAINLLHPAKKITVGIPYNFEMETLNIEGENTHGLKKIIHNINIKVNKSRQDFFVEGVLNNVQNARSIDSINNSNLLFTGDIEVFPFSDYKEETTVKISQPFPLPLTISSISIDVSVEDNA